MSKLIFRLALLFLGASAVLALVNVAVGENATFTVQPSKTHVITLSLRETDSVSGSFSVVSDDDTGVNFFITDPYNNTVLRYDNVLQKNFSFTVATDGNYKLHFDNSVSTVFSKAVSLNYSTIHYIMGMPQEQFWFLVIAAVALIGVMLYVVLMPK